MGLSTVTWNLIVTLLPAGRVPIVMGPTGPPDSAGADRVPRKSGFPAPIVVEALTTILAGSISEACSDSFSEVNAKVNVFAEFKFVLTVAVSFTAVNTGAACEAESLLDGWAFAIVLLSGSIAIGVPQPAEVAKAADAVTLTGVPPFDFVVVTHVAMSVVIAPFPTKF